MSNVSLPIKDAEGEISQRENRSQNSNEILPQGNGRIDNKTNTANNTNREHQVDTYTHMNRTQPVNSNSNSIKEFFAKNKKIVIGVIIAVIGLAIVIPLINFLINIIFSLTKISFI